MVVELSTCKDAILAMNIGRSKRSSPVMYGVRGFETLDCSASSVGTGSLDDEVIRREDRLGHQDARLSIEDHSLIEVFDSTTAFSPGRAALSPISCGGIVVRGMPDKSSDSKLNPH